MDGDAGVLLREVTGLGGDDGELAGQGEAGHDGACLENDSGITKDVVDGSIDVALTVELAEGVDVEGVLVADYGAFVHRH